MSDLPHLYTVKSAGGSSGHLTSQAEGLPNITIAPPSQFGGPGDQWSPEDLLMASVSSCLILSFRAIAKASKLEWHSIECESSGVLDKVERKMQFTSVLNKVRLFIPSNESQERAQRLIIKAEETCLISNSLSCESHIECEIILRGE
ncbi:MAG: OsmC family protein [Halioglobus sp.]